MIRWGNREERIIRQDRGPELHVESVDRSRVAHDLGGELNFVRLSLHEFSDLALVVLVTFIVVVLVSFVVVVPAANPAPAHTRFPGCSFVLIPTRSVAPIPTRLCLSLPIRACPHQSPLIYADPLPGHACLAFAWPLFVLVQSCI